MSEIKTKPSSGRRSKSERAIWGVILLAWLGILCFVPDPRPLGAPEWSVESIRFMLGLSEPASRALATIVLRGVGLGLIGILVALFLSSVRMLWAAPADLIAAPLLGVGTQWINFGYFPVMPQFQFIVVVAILGALAGLVFRRSRIALAAFVGLAVVLFAWGTSTSVPDDLYEAARATGLHVLENSQNVPKGDEAFAKLIEIAFAYAADNSHGTSAVMPNQAAILALGVILGEDRVAQVGGHKLDSGNKKQRDALRRRVTIHDRSDLPQHFWVSAALAVLADEKRSLTVGIVKEMKDSTPGGSGFSFVDMVANKAGIRFAVVATRDSESARLMQMRIVQGVHRDDFVPGVNGLPEEITQDEFHSDFGGMGGEETQRLFAEIDRRISACEGLQ